MVYFKGKNSLHDDKLNCLQHRLLWNSIHFIQKRRFHRQHEFHNPNVRIWLGLPFACVNSSIFMGTEKNLAQKIYAAVRLIPKGKVASYSQVAALLGNRNLRRYVGNALHKNPSNSVTPCHRVVNAKGFCSGSFAFGGSGVQRQKLETEGVTFTKGHVDMEKHAISQDDFDAMSARLGQEWGADED